MCISSKRDGHRGMAKVGVGGTINGYGVLVLGDTVGIEGVGAEVARRRAQGLAGSSAWRGT